MRDTATRSIRQGTLFATWTLQVALYPIYLVFQSSRVVGRQLQSSVRRTVPRLKAVGEALDRAVHPEKSSTSALNVDTPFKNLVRSLPQDVPNLIEADRLGTYVTLPAGQEQLALQEASPQYSSLALIPPIDSLPPGSTAETAIAPSPPPVGQSTDSNPQTINGNTRIPIQGMASLLDSHHLVLVGANNHILDILSPDQQDRLKERMVLEVALYRQRQQQRTVPPAPPLRRLPIPRVTDRQWLPVQWFRRVMAWMQTSDVAIATNLFQESLMLPAGRTSSRQSLADARSISPWDWYTLTPSSQTLMRAIKPTVQPAQIHPTTPPMALGAATNPQLPGISPIYNSAPLSLWARLRAWLSSVPVAQDSSIETELDLLSWQTPSGAIAPSTKGVIHKNSSKEKRFIVSRGNSSRSLEPSMLPTKSDAIDPGGDLANLETVHSKGTSDIEAQPEWVETSAIVVGYAKHPLELILQWLDLGVAWVEERVTRVWQWLTGRSPNPPQD